MINWLIYDIIVFMNQGYRIISVEAADIYKNEQEYGVAVGYKLPETKSDAYFWLFKNKLDYSLDSIELEKAYTRICRKKFSFVADGAIEKVNASTTAITEKVKAAEQEIARVKDDIHFERGFRKFFFWATPIMLLIQTVAIIILAI